MDNRTQNLAMWPHRSQCLRESNGGLCSNEDQYNIAAQCSVTISRDSLHLIKRPVNTCRDKKVTSSTRATLPVDINGFHEAKFLSGQGRRKLCSSPVCESGRYTTPLQVDVKTRPQSLPNLCPSLPPPTHTHTHARCH
jgi:hypothetical protein